MTARALISTRSLRPLAFLALAVLGFGAVAPSPDASGGGPLTVASVTWDVVGLDSNNVNVGPNVFPVGVRVCNTGSEAVANVVATWTWKTSQNAFTGPADGTTVTAGTMAGGACRQVFFETTVNRSPSSRLKSRDYQITVTGDGGVSASTPQRQLYVEKLVSQNRNSTKKLAGPGGCNLTYTVCDPAPTNVVIGRTYTYKFYAETSTAYQQLETFVNFPTSIVEVVSTSATYSNPTGATSNSIYADACGWSTTPTTRACVGPANVTGGKAGGRIVVTYVVRAVAPGSGSLKSTIYDFSGSSYHYNSDHDSFALASGPFTARYGVDATIVGNGKVTSSPNGTRSDGTSAALDCGGTGVTCSVGYATGTTVTLTAQPLGGDTFAGWSGGGCTGTALTCTVTMSQSRSVTATFTGATSHLLEVSKAGSGTVTADSGSLNCGATCAARYGDGTLVTLTASAGTGWTFAGWSGEGCSGTSTCQVTMSQARSVTASFVEQTYALGVSTSGNGTVTSSPGTINCGNGNTFCSDVYGSGTVVTLTATPGSGQVFTGWSGDCLGVTTTCSVTLSQARSTTASFTGTTTYPLDVGVGGSGTGTVTSDVGGINCGSTCSASYASGTTVTLTAAAGSGSNFVGWSGDCAGTSTTCVVTMNQARNVFATFGSPQTLTVTKNGSGAGTVTSDVGGINCGATCSASFAEGTVVTLTATASAGSVFTGWSGDCSGTGGTCTVTMSAARAVTAMFAPAYTLSVTKAGSGTGTVTSDVGGVSCGATCSASYADGTVVTLTAAASAGARFAGWSGVCTGTSTCTVTMSAARSVTATFVALRTLSVTKTGSGTGSVGSDVAGIACGATCAADYDDGTVVTLTATAASGSRFAGWSGACTGTGACTVTMSAARTATATFVAVHTLEVAKSGTGSGTIASDVAGISCGATCSAGYDDGTTVTLTATPASGSRFTGWSGACTGTAACTVTMTAARSVTAAFVAVHTLAVTKAGSGAGTVGSDVAGVDCGDTCTADFDDGTVVTLTATASSGSRFTGWSGAGCTGTGGCTVTMTAARSVTAGFVARYAVTVTKNGSGDGSVSSDVGGIDCGATCTADYDDGTTVTLTATPTSGSRFTGWSGAGCTGTGACVVTTSAARSVTASFVAQYALTVAKSGSGTGSVSSDAGGIDCGATCAADYDDGAVVTLTATASSGSRFTGWSGAGCSGTSTCTVTMTAARSVTAGFVVLRTLTVAKSGSGTGGVSSDAGGVDCGSTCSADYDDGSTVTLTATPASGSRFAGWSGACTGTSTCTVTMSAARSVTATFVALRTLSVTKTGSGTGSVGSDVAGIACGTTCAADYDDGTVVTLTATASSGSRFTGWSGACTGTSTCTVTMTAARTVTAGFVAVYPLDVAKSGSGGGTIASDVAGINCGATCTADYDDGTAVVLTATASPGSTFTGWSGDCSGTGACSLTMSAARNVTATFVADNTLQVTKSGSGGGTVTSDVPGVDCGSTCSAGYAPGTVVALTAAPDSGSRFAGWSGACSGTGSCEVTMSGARAVTATFVAVHTLEVFKTGSGTGRVDGAGISCGAVCSVDHDAGADVTLTAAAAPGSRFAGWSGAGCSGTGSCTVTMSAARSVTATFVAVYRLAVTRSGSGTGAVRSDVGGVDCGSTCSAEYDDGTTVVLTATPSSGSTFAGWSGDCSGSGTCMVTMAAARNVVASFAVAVVDAAPVSPPVTVRHTLTVTKAGSGSGRVAATGIDCGVSCSAQFEQGTTVVLTATPAATSRFAGWTGDGCSGTRPCTVTMSAARHVTATFVQLVPLAVAVDGKGSVTTAETQCRTACSTTHDARARVTLVATPRPGYWFTGWSGACRGRSPRCTVPMSRARLVRAHFARELQLHLHANGRPVLHLPYGRAVVTAVASWRRRPLRGATVQLVMTCPGKRVGSTLRTGRDGRIAFSFGRRIRNAIRIQTCRIDGRVAARGTTAAAQRPASVQFVHPLWLEIRARTRGAADVRIWGRAGELVELVAGERVVAWARIGSHGWVDVRHVRVRRGSRLRANGRSGHHSHVIRT